MLKLSRFWRNRTEEIAAVDLGSNSFHMIIARVSGGQITIIDRLKEPVRLGYGLSEDGELDDLSQRRALDCLERFHQRIRHLPADCVRAVGTRTLRQAKNAAFFVAQAENALGFDIQVVSGAEEARLVYQGVAFGLEDDQQTRLVIDIGGGSTELIIGEDFTPRSLESLGMGCVSITKRFFDNGKLSRKNIRAAEIYCLQKLEPFISHFRRQQWQRAIGCSGSIKSISSVIEQMTGQSLITAEGLDKVMTECQSFKTIDELKLEGLSKTRQPVFIGGLVVLRSVMQSLKLSELEASPWALREGVLFDLLGHDSMSDMREHSVQELSSRFHADSDHAEYCNEVAQKLLRQVQDNHTFSSDWQRYLQWACLLQEVGLDINHDNFHLHSGYIVANTHLAGFGVDEQNRLAALVQNQRKKPDWRMIEAMPEEEQDDFVLILHIFRLACVLTRSRDKTQDIGWSLNFSNNQLVFSAPPPWWAAHPLAAADLEAESRRMKKSRYKLMLNRPGDD